RNLSTAHVHDVSLQSYPREIVGIAGLLGSGRTELMNAIFGIDKHIEGKILIAGEEKNISSTKQAINAGVTLVPENRREQGLVLDFKVSTNIVMSILEKLKRLLFMDRSKEATLSMSYIDSMNIKTQGIQQIVRFLSGGNQQKIVVAKCLATNSSILLLDDPTFGVDIHAKYEIMKIIKDFADQGNTVLFISSEFKEIVEFSDSIYVMKRGEISQFISDRISEDELLQVVQ
ncbi:MAG: ATP-binding cassette domain-containing protein, partial [Salinispira sp.]